MTLYGSRVHLDYNFSVSILSFNVYKADRLFMRLVFILTYAFSMVRSSTPWRF